MMKYFVILVLLATAVLWWLGWIPSFNRNQDEKPIPTAKAIRTDITPELPLSGEVKPAFQVDVKPEIGGKIQKIHVIPGQSVKKGDLLVTIDDTDLLNERAAADAEIEGAQLSVQKIRGNYDRARQLHERKLLSEEVFSNLEADYHISLNTLEKSNRRRQTVDDRLSKTRVVAPFDGTILEIPVNEGQVVVGAASVNSGTSLMTFADLSSLLIISQVNQLDANKLTLGQEVILNSPNSEDSDASAKINFIAPLATVKNNIKGFEVRGRIEKNGAGLKPGLSVRVRVPLGKAIGVVAVPLTAVFEQKNDKVAYVLEDGKSERREVTVGIIDNEFAEIRSGVQEGDDVLLVEPVESAAAVEQNAPPPNGSKKIAPKKS